MCTARHTMINDPTTKIEKWSRDTAVKIECVEGNNCARVITLKQNAWPGIKEYLRKLSNNILSPYARNNF